MLRNWNADDADDTGFRGFLFRQFTRILKEITFL